MSKLKRFKGYSPWLWQWCHWQCKRPLTRVAMINIGCLSEFSYLLGLGNLVGLIMAWGCIQGAGGEWDGFWNNTKSLSALCMRGALMVLIVSAIGLVLHLYAALRWVHSANVPDRYQLNLKKMGWFSLAWPSLTLLLALCWFKEPITTQVSIMGAMSLWTMLAVMQLQLASSLHFPSHEREWMSVEWDPQELERYQVRYEQWLLSVETQKTVKKRVQESGEHSGVIQKKTHRL